MLSFGVGCRFLTSSSGVGTLPRSRNHLFAHDMVRGAGRVERCPNRVRTPFCALRPIILGGWLGDTTRSLSAHVVIKGTTGVGRCPNKVRTPPSMCWFGHFAMLVAVAVVLRFIPVFNENDTNRVSASRVGLRSSLAAKLQLICFTCLATFEYS